MTVSIHPGWFIFDVVKKEKNINFNIKYLNGDETNKWPNSDGAVIYIYSLVDSDASAPPSEIKPNDILYLGERERASKSNMKKSKNEYPWSKNYLNKRLLCLYFEIDSRHSIQSDTDKRHSLEFMTALKLFENHSNLNPLRENSGFQFKFSWTKACDVIALRDSIIADLKQYNL